MPPVATVWAAAERTSADRPRVAIVGGGLAGMAAAAALVGTDACVELFESRARFGGRATSFRDPETGELVDFCQHVSMGCCTNLADLVRRAGLDGLFKPADRLTFIAPDGRQCDFAASRWLPAPLHLALGLGRLVYLDANDRRAIARAMWRLMRRPIVDGGSCPTALEWLRAQGQTARAIDWFWGVVLVSALGESLERVSMAAARKVFVDGFLAARDAHVVQTPQLPLGEIFGRRLPAWLESQGASLRLGATIRAIDRDARGRFELAGLDKRAAAHDHAAPYDCVILATTWRQVESLLPEAWRAKAPWLAAARGWPSAPITGVHLWFDRPITDLEHAVLVGRLGQWLFNRGALAGDLSAAGAAQEFYYQVVISASRDLAGRDRQAIVDELVGELAEIWPAARQARLLRARVVTEQMAVFSVAPGCDAWRPPQRTEIEGLALAGDWTATGWPATMEGAVRSGYLAAEAVMASLGRPRRFLAPDLERAPLAKLLIRD